MAKRDGILKPRAGGQGWIAWQRRFDSEAALELPALRSLDLAYKEKPGSYRYPLHAHPYQEFYYVDKGRIHYRCGSLRGGLEQCQGVFLPAGAPHAFVADLREPPNILDIHFRSPNLFKVLPELRALAGRPISLDAAAQAGINDLCREARARPASASRRVASGFAALLLRLPLLAAPGRAASRPGTRAPALAQEMERYCLAHLRDKLTLEEVSRALRVSPSTLARDLRRAGRSSPRQWILSLRARRAKELLRSGGASVKEIAFLTGFCNPSALVRAFRKSEGMTPGVYRRTLTL